MVPACTAVTKKLKVAVALQTLPNKTKRLSEVSAVQNKQKLHHINFCFRFIRLPSYSRMIVQLICAESSRDLGLVKNRFEVQEKVKEDRVARCLTYIGPHSDRSQRACRTAQGSGLDVTFGRLLTLSARVLTDGKSGLESRQGCQRYY